MAALLPYVLEPNAVSMYICLWLRRWSTSTRCELRIALLIRYATFPMDALVGFGRRSLFNGWNRTGTANQPKAKLLANYGSSASQFPTDNQITSSLVWTNEQVVSSTSTFVNFKTLTLIINNLRYLPPCFIAHYAVPLWVQSYTQGKVHVPIFSFSFDIMANDLLAVKPRLPENAMLLNVRSDLLYYWILASRCARDGLINLHKVGDCWTFPTHRNHSSRRNAYPECYAGCEFASHWNEWG